MFLSLTECSIPRELSLVSNVSRASNPNSSTYMSAWLSAEVSSVPGMMIRKAALRDSNSSNLERCRGKCKLPIALRIASRHSADGAWRSMWRVSCFASYCTDAATMNCVTSLKARNPRNQPSARIGPLSGETTSAIACSDSHASSGYCHILAKIANMLEGQCQYQICSDVWKSSTQAMWLAQHARICGTELVGYFPAY